MPVFHYTLDNEAQETQEHRRTANQILDKGGIDPTDHYLVELKGSTRESFQGKGETEIQMHEHMRFVSVFTGPTPVSAP